MAETSVRKRRRTMLRLYPDEEEQDALDEGISQEQEPSDPMDMPQSNDGISAFEDEDDMFMQAAPNDTYLALQLLRSQFPAKAREVIQPIMLRSQVYSLVDDRTMVDRELDELRLNHDVRVLKLPTAPDDYAFMLADDYAAAIEEQRDILANTTPAEQLQVFSWFSQRVAARCSDNCITHDSLLKMLSLDRKHKRKDGVTEQHASLLLSSGLLTRHLTQRDAYWFALAGIGPLVKSLVKGRKDVLGMLARRRYPEIFIKELEQKKLGQSLLDTKFHMRDLLGLRSVEKVETPSGPLLRAVKR